jgi:hypothetical protein
MFERGPRTAVQEARALAVTRGGCSLGGGFDVQLVNR